MNNAPDSLKPVIESIRNGLRTAGFANPEVHCEPVAGTRLHRLIVVSPTVEGMMPSEVQSIAWRLVDVAMPDQREQLRTISMILAFSPKDLGADSQAA